MEFGTIERELYIEAAPEVVYDVVSNPEHVQQWWPEQAEFEARPGSEGTITFGEPGTDVTVERLSVVDAQPHRSFSFRWTHPAGEQAAEGNSLLVTFDLEPSGAGTMLRMTETGFREMGWEVAVLEENYRGHVTGWDHYLPRLVRYAAGVGAAR